MNQFIIKQAKGLLKGAATAHEAALMELCWLESTQGDIDDGNYCRPCAEKKVKKSSVLEIMTSCGGYESDQFHLCNECGAELQVSILPTEEQLQCTLEELKSPQPTITAIYQAHELLYNAEQMSDDARITELTEQLAEYVVDTFILHEGIAVVK